ncbi:MoaF C-terminal domain-containing protein [Nocardioides hungaricus]
MSNPPPENDAPTARAASALLPGPHAGGLTENRLPSTADLDGRACRALDQDDPWSVSFDSGVATWALAIGEGADRYDAVRVAPEKYLVDVWLRSSSDLLALTLLLDLDRGTYLRVDSICRPESTPVVVDQEFFAGRLEGHSSVEEHEVPEETDALEGMSLTTSYNDEFVFEHEYLDGLCRWHCVRGEAPGSRDADPATFWAIGDDQYLIGFRERVIHCASVFVMDLRALRCTGKYLALENGVAQNGALGSVLSLSTY